MHTPPDDSAWNTIVRHLAGELSDAEEKVLAQRLGDDREWRALHEQLSGVWERSRGAGESWDARAALERIKGARSPKVIPLRPVRDAGAHVRWSRRWIVAGRAAAAIIACAGLGAIAWSTSREQPAMPAAEPISLVQEVTTRPGQRATLQLVDGSRITLGVASSIRYPKQFAATGAREVELSGEAYFEVTHDAARPFRVRAGGAVAHDLGTHFLVRAYPDASHTDVVVTEGSVSLSAARHAADPRRGAFTGRARAGADSLVLGASDFGRIDRAGRLAVERNVDTRPFLAWTRGQLEFLDTPVAEVAAQIERWYGVEVRLEDASLAGQRFTATFDTEPLDAVLRSLTTAIGGRAERDGAVVRISAASGPR